MPSYVDFLLLYFEYFVDSLHLSALILQPPSFAFINLQALFARNTRGGVRPYRPNSS